MARRAFTIIEMALAAVLLALLMGTVGVFVSGLGSSRERLTGTLGELVACGSLFDRLQSDLMTSLAGGGRLGAGIEGTSDRLTLLRRGVVLAVDAPADRRSVDLQSIEYVFASSGPSASELLGAPASPGGSAGNATEAGGGVRVTERAGGSVISRLTLGTRIAKLRFRYFDGREWVDSYSSLTTGTIPVAVEASVWLVRDADPDDAALASGDVGGGIGGLDDSLLDQQSASNEGGPEDQAPDGLEQTRAPDRVRVIVVPDGPSVGWEGDA